MCWCMGMLSQWRNKWKKSRSTPEFPRCSWQRLIISRIRKNPETHYYYRYGDSVAQLVRDLTLKGGYDKVVSSSSAFGKDLVPRVGGLLDVQPITDITQIIVCISVFKHFSKGWRKPFREIDIRRQCCCHSIQYRQD